MCYYYLSLVSHFKDFYPTQSFPIQLHERLACPSAINHSTQTVWQTALLHTDAAQPEHETNVVARFERSAASVATPEDAAGTQPDILSRTHFQRR